MTWQSNNENQSNSKMFQQNLGKVHVPTTLTKSLAEKQCDYFVWFIIARYTGFSQRCGGLMVSALDSRLCGPGLSPGQGHCVVFLGRTLYSYSTSLHPGAQMGTGEFNVGGNSEVD